MVESHWAVFAIGAAWNVLITVFAITGLKMVVRFEWVIVLFQYAVLLIVAIVALLALLHGADRRAVSPGSGFHGRAWAARRA